MLLLLSFNSLSEALNLALFVKSLDFFSLYRVDQSASFLRELHPVSIPLFSVLELLIENFDVGLLLAVQTNSELILRGGVEPFKRFGFHRIRADATMDFL